jgi:hypothetical protein
VRDGASRKADTLRLLATPAIDVWVATASASGVPHLVPLSLAWVDERVVIALEASSSPRGTWRPPETRGSPPGPPATW